MTDGLRERVNMIESGWSLRRRKTRLSSSDRAYLRSVDLLLRSIDLLLSLGVSSCSVLVT